MQRASWFLLQKWLKQYYRNVINDMHQANASHDFKGSLPRILLITKISAMFELAYF